MRKIGLAIAAFAAVLGTAGYLVGRAESPKQPRLISHVRLSAIYSVKARPPYAYALEYGLLHVLDVSKPKHVRKVSELPFKLGRSRISIYRHFLFFYGFGTPLGLADISQPEKPRWVAEFPELGGILTSGMEISGETLYAVSIAGWEFLKTGAPVSLQIIDIHNPRRPARLATMDIDVTLRHVEGVNVAAAGNRLYLLVRNARQEKSRSEVIRINVADRSHPFIERRDLLPQGKNFKTIRVLGNTMYVLEMAPQHGLALFRLNEDAAPTPIGEITDPSLRWGMELVINQNYVYATFKSAGANVVTFDVSNPAQPRIVDKYSIEGFGAAGLGMDMVDGRLYVAGDWAPLPIFDVSRGLPREIGLWEYRGGWAMDLAVKGSELYVANWGGGLVAYDVHDPSAPSLRWRHDPPRWAETWQDLTLPRVWGADLLLGFGTRPAELLDVRGRKPKLVASYQPAGQVSALAVCSEYAYFGLTAAPSDSNLKGEAGAGGIDVVRRQEEILNLVARVKLPAGVAELVAGDGRVVTVTKAGEILTFDARDPAALRQTGQLRIGEAAKATRLAVAGNYAFVLAQTETGANLYIIDLAGQGLRIAYQRYFEDGGESAALAVSDKYLALYAGQLKVLDISNPAAPVLVTEQQLESLGEPPALAIDTGHLYVSDGEAGIWIYDLPSLL